MTGITALVAALLLALLAGTLVSARRRRRGSASRPLAIATPGARAFASHVGSLNTLGMGLQLPHGRRR